MAAYSEMASLTVPCQLGLSKKKKKKIKKYKNLAHRQTDLASQVWCV